MNGARAWLCGAALAALLPGQAPDPAAALPGGVAVEPPARAPRFGEPFALALVVEWPADAALQPLDFAAWPQLTLVATGRRAVPASAPDRRAERHTFTATAWQAGALELPPLPAQAQRGGRLLPLAAGAPWRLQVASGLADPPGELEWPGDVRDLPSPWGPRWLLAGLALLATAGFAARRRRRGAAAPTAAAAPPSPGPAFAAELAALRLPPAGAPAAVLAFHSDLAALLGRAQAVRAGAPTTAWTSAERVRQAGAAAAPLQQCLGACDLVKFAAARPDAAAIAAARAAAAQCLAAWWPQPEAR